MSSNQSETFTLFVLGTDGKYTPEEGYLSEIPPDLNKKEKLRQAKLQNTLSFIAKSIATEEMTDELIDIKDGNGNLPEQMKLVHRNAVLLDGPDTAGMEVHNLTAYGVLTILNAILQDKKKINLVGFSRGAVIIIQIINYLQSMKGKLAKSVPNNLTADDFYNQILLCGRQGTSASPGGWIRNRIDCSKKLIMDILANPDNLNKIIGFFKSPDIMFRMFCLDPVQGPGWSHSYHFQIPEIVNDIEILYHEDERSYGFNPLCPKVSASNSITLSSYFNLPGFHGIGDGNPFDHSFNKLDLSEKELSSRRLIQEIVFLKILKMLKNSGVQFQPSITKTALDDCLNECIQSENIDALLLLHYDELFKSLAFLPINDWRDGAYVPVNKDRSIEPRLVKIASEIKAPLNQIVAFDINADRQFVNREHLQLAFNQLLNDFDTSFSYSSPVNQLLAQFTRLFSKIEEGTLDVFFENHENCQEQSAKAYQIIQSSIQNLVSMSFKKNLTLKEIEAIKKFYERLSNLSPPASPTKKIVQDRKIRLIEHMNISIRQSFEEQLPQIFTTFFKFNELLQKFIDSKNIYILDEVVEKKNQFLNLQQGLQFNQSKIAQDLERLLFAAISIFHCKLNVMIFSSQVFPSNILMLKLNEEILLKSNMVFLLTHPDEYMREQFHFPEKNILPIANMPDENVNLLQSPQQLDLEHLAFSALLEFQNKLNVMIFSCQFMPSQLFILRLNNGVVKEFLEKLSSFCIQQIVKKSLTQSSRNILAIENTLNEEVNLLQSPQQLQANENIEEVQSPVWSSYSMGISLLMSSGIAFSISVGLFVTLGPVAYVPGSILMVIGLLSLIMAGNALFQQENAFIPRPGFSLR